MDTKIRQNMVDYLNKYYKDIELSTQLENRAYDDIKENILLNLSYKHKYNYNVYFMIMNCDEIIKKKINPEDIFVKTSKELFPKHWEESQRRRDEEENYVC